VRVLWDVRKFRYSLEPFNPKKRAAARTGGPNGKARPQSQRTTDKDA
jgi:hypothetical protein